MEEEPKTLHNEFNADQKKMRLLLKNFHHKNTALKKKVSLFDTANSHEKITKVSIQNKKKCFRPIRGMFQYD